MSKIMEPDYPSMDILAEFEANASLKDGVSGKKRINSNFENTSETYVQHPRSEGSYKEIKGYNNG